MSLEQYRRKRDFTRTAEPRGAATDRRPLPFRRFVVGRHRASRLHYDLRLEVGDVLVSWAVPRGPSMAPLARRRAARTEDHPLEYLDFEGVIPQGQYGGGDAIVWDHGTWDTELDEDPAGSIEAGELKFVLHGERLRGRFAIVRTGTDRGREDWLLIRKREGAVEGWDIDDHPTSILSGRTNEEVAAGVPAEIAPMATLSDIDLGLARPAGTPAFVPPMLASPVEGPFDDPDWLFELKLDGYRVQAVVHEGSVRLWTRRHKDAAAYFPDFARLPPAWMAVGDAVVDGEMVALDAAGRPDFGLLQELTGLRGLGVKRRERSPSPAGDPAPAEAREGSLVYHAFDLLQLAGWDLTPMPLQERKRLLRLVLRDHPSVRYVSHVPEHGAAFQAAVVEQGLEGSLAKRRTSPYEPGVRSRDWLKVKARREQELVVIGYERGQGERQDLGSLIVATHEADGWRFAGHVGSGLDERARRRLRDLVEEAPRDTPVVPGLPVSASARYCEPRHVVRAEFSEWTSDGLLRQAVYRGLDIDHDPLTVSREATARPGETTAPRARTRPAAAPATAIPRPASEEAAGEPEPEEPVATATPAELEALETLGDGGRWEVGGHDVRLTNLDKVLFPGAGFTKRDLVRYYATIAPVILPYLRDRPINVHRWPDGVGGSIRFWQKQIPPHAPAWVERWEYPEAGRSQSHTYVVADRVATMAWLANQACIDLHPWTSRLPDYRRPTYAYIDIDPGTETTWSELVTLARLYRTALEHLGVRGFPKVTGKRGIQVWIHVEPRYSFDQTREWVGELSRGVGAVVPELVSWEWSKAERGGRARLDYTQNSFIKTLVAPYAVRPVPSGAVSAPIDWDELDDAELGAQRWDMRTIVERVAERGDRFAGVLRDPQVLPPIS
jgi:bifunctional non-homologous end joining protein LigD